MERKDNGAKPLGFCYRLYNYLMKNLASIRDKLAVQGVAGKDAKSQFEHSVDEEGEVLLLPPVITIPVEYQETMEKVSATMSNVEEKSAPREDKGQDMLKRRPSIGERDRDEKDDDKLKGKELKKKVSLGRPPSKEMIEGQVSGVRPVKPVVRSVSNIDKKVDAFIRERKESFGAS